ncbi:hypothetical protein KQX54_015461 [Cotesia glomerata]|uniref:Uncharacterized protein n=1 Tax=Cotesia glomerata TaxID=32391 RepID=A0AAV7II89_COTGL|nr:hypothetical protein KQX54_015461 [Cotesia glomerata]
MNLLLPVQRRHQKKPPAIPFPLFVFRHYYAQVGSPIKWEPIKGRMAFEALILHRQENTNYDKRIFKHAWMSMLCETEHQILSSNSILYLHCNLLSGTTLKQRSIIL